MHGARRPDGRSRMAGRASGLISSRTSRRAQQEVEEQQQQQQQWSGSLGTRRSYNHPELPAAPGDDARRR